MSTKISHFLFALSVASIANPANAASPYVSLQDSYLNSRIEQLVVVSNIPALTKPYKVQLVRNYLDKIKLSYPRLYQQINTKLTPYEQTAALVHGQLGLSLAAGDAKESKAMPNSRGELVNSSYQASLIYQYQPFDWLAFSAGALAYGEPNEILPVDSYLVLGVDAFQLDFGFREHWFSPFQDSAMLVSTNARPSVSVGISNAQPFNNLLNLNYELFVTRLERVDGIAYEDRLESGKPALMGFHLSFEPVSGWVIGANRTFQFGGGSREVNLKTIWGAFWDPVSNDNTMEGCDSAYKNTCEAGNQIASVTSRMNFKGKTPFSIYMEYAGEDTSEHSNFRLGNLGISAGLFIPFLPDYLLGRDWSFIYEFNEWQDAWYVHHIYKEGYVNDGRNMGHWGGENKVKGESVGSRVHMFHLSWQPKGHLVNFKYRQQENPDYRSDIYHTAHEIELSYRSSFFSHFWELSFYGGTTVFDDDFSRLSLSLEW